MKKISFIIIIDFFVLTLLVASPVRTEFDLEALNYTDDIYLNGVTSYMDLFYPVYSADNLSNAEFSLHYAFTQFVGLDSMYTIFVNDEPIHTFYFLDYEGAIRIKIPEHYLEPSSLLKITLAVTLDYSICDNKRIETNALWFRISRETTLSYEYELTSVNTIPEFFSIFNPKKTYNIVINDPLKNIQAIANIGEHLGYTGKALEQTPVTSFSTSLNVNNIILTDKEAEYAVTISHETLYLDPNADVYNSFKPLYYNYAPSSSLTVLELNGTKRENFVPLRSFGVTDSNINVVYSTIRSYNFGIDAFGGVPQNTELTLNFSVFNRLHSSGNTLAVFLNGYLLKSYNLNDLKKIMYTDVIKIPSDYFSAFNTLSFEMKNMMSDCDEFTIKLYPNSPIYFSGVMPLEKFKINDFPNSLYGNTLYVVSQKSKAFADNLLKIAFEKGKASVFPDRAYVFTTEEILDPKFDFEKYDSIVFLINSQEVSKIDKLLDLSDSFKLKNNNGEILFDASSNGDFNIVRVFEFEGLPAILFTHYGQNSLKIDKTFVSEIKRIPGNLGILTDHEMFSFVIGDKSETFFLEADEVTQHEKLLKFWEKYRLWIIIVIAAIILIIILISYVKTSRGR